MKYIITAAFAFQILSVFGQIAQKTAIDEIFEDWNKKDVPGCGFGVIQDGKLTYARGYGQANLDYGIPNDENTVFRIGSTSKQFTAACIMLLVEQGKVDLDSSLKSFYPAFPDYAKDITVRHLLNHTSGIRDYLVLSVLKGLGDDDYYEDEDVMRWLIAQEELNFTPGDEFLYSNSGYWLLGQIVNDASGMGMAEFAEKHIFDPLEMTNTHFHDDHTAIVKNRASGYDIDETDSTYYISQTTLDMIGDGGIFTTINDIKKWDDAYYKSVVLSRGFWANMTQRGVLNNGDTISYAAGLFIRKYKGLHTVSHGGAFVGYRAELLRFPDQKLSVAVFANRADANPSARARKVAELLLKDQLVDATKKVDSEFKSDQLKGTYAILPGMNMQVSMQGDSVHVLQLWNKSEYNITRTKKNTYQIPNNPTITFIFGKLEDGLAQEVTVFQNGAPSTAKRVQEKVADEQVVAISTEQSCGTYEVMPGMEVTISMKDDSLNIYQSWNKVGYNVQSTGLNSYQIPNQPSITFTFTTLENDVAQALKVIQNGTPSIAKRKAVVDLENLNVKEFSGDFNSAELGITYEISVQNDTLQLVVNDDEPFQLIPYDKDVFTVDGLILRFKREAGKVTGIRLDAGRVKNLKFTLTGK